MKPCGTAAAARRHYRNGEPLCDPCRAAANVYQNKQKARKRAERRAAGGVPKRRPDRRQYWEATPETVAKLGRRVNILGEVCR